MFRVARLLARLARATSRRIGRSGGTTAPGRLLLKASPRALARMSRELEAGSVLVSAVFEAFTTVVKRKTGRLFSIAGLDLQAIGRVPLSDALVKALAQEASDVASAR